MAIYRNVQLSFWTDNKVEDNFTPEDKYFYIYLLTNPQTNICGCYEVSYSQMTRQTGYNKETINRLLDRFENIHKVIKYDKENKEVLILNWYKYNWSKSKDTLKGVRKVAQHIKTESFKEHVFCIIECLECDTPIRGSIDPLEASVSDTDSDSVSDYNNINNKSNSKSKKKIKIYYQDDEKLNEAFAEFVKMRKQIDKPMTDRAISRAKTRLQNLSNGDNELAVNILDQSIFHCWQDLYELKNDNSWTGGGKNEKHQGTNGENESRDEYAEQFFRAFEE